MAADEVKKSPRAEKEEEILAFWKERDIFNKTLTKDAPAGEFVFYDGPPFATGLPHYGSLLSSVIKDVVPRYKTMRGFRVRRRWGWDCHGLPIENLVEKKLGLKSKKDIEDLGLAKFNEEARSMVLEYASDWERYVERIGRWVEFKNSYKTMDTTYIESVWWALKKLYDDGRLYEGRKVLMYCPHDETPLSKAEIAMDNSYEDVTEEAVTVKFKVKNPKDYKLPDNTYLLAWTTTPWTLPGNVALAVGEKIDYIVAEKEGERLILAKALHEKVAKEYTETKTIKGSSLVGIEYEPLFEIGKVREEDSKGAAWKVHAADFVSTEDGTGIVHTAVIYGEDDFALGKQVGLPMVPLLDPSGRFNAEAPELVRGKYFKYHDKGFRGAEKGQDAETFIKADLEKRGLLFAKEKYTHSYPHCYRCGTPLIYNALPSWFIDVQSVKEKMLQHNESVTWIPEHLKHGRFQNIVENAPDWNISRNRFWASPLPIWKNPETGATHVIGSIEALKRHTKKSGNRYLVMRHGESESNVQNIVSSRADNPHPLTEKGREEAAKGAASIKESGGVDLIIASPFVRTRETAEIVARTIGYPVEAIIIDERFSEIDTGVFNNRPIGEYHAYFSSVDEKFTKRPDGGENWNDVKKRVGTALHALEEEWSGKRILIVTHDSPILHLHAVAQGLTCDECIARKKEVGGEFIKTGSWGELAFVPLPHNADFEIDLHRPYIDDYPMFDSDGAPLVRTPEVVDCWVESGSMPFAEWHYPMEHTKEFESRFPGDFIAEYIAQTRTWFYYMHAMGVLLFGSPAFKNVVSTGTILAADGSKMSKSKGNYTDPLANLDRFGADALRYYLMESVVMQAEDLRFRDDALREAHNRVINILWNTYQFYDLYKKEYDGSTQSGDSKSVLDRWIRSRLAETVAVMTEAMEAYDLPRATRPIAGFVDDFSTWYVRRSRDRLKAGDAKDKQYTLATMREVLLEFSKAIAPVMPFIAESIYQGVGGGEESVHLDSFPEAGAIDSELVTAMASVRTAVSLALKKRAEAGIKVRQPLQSVTIKSAPKAVAEDVQLRTLIADELNVKEVALDASLAEEVVLDTTMTPELKQEGDLRDLVRAVQDERKKAGLAPGDRITLTLSANKEGASIIEKFKEELQRQTGSDTLATADGDVLFSNIKVEKR